MADEKLDDTVEVIAGAEYHCHTQNIASQTPVFFFKSLRNSHVIVKWGKIYALSENF